ncbi:hypothetical protein ANN_16796 [Periplaneta americana]|uniref:Uncharacterized protein n=1 Tax=Periplaneta americana TaxID=6978 RepID=A0ABQ8STA1_PERAM|nr:hypothetical protein ANN_16796 [Periplaneta americana]
MSKPRECEPFTFKLSMTEAFRGECNELSEVLVGQQYRYDFDHCVNELLVNGSQFQQFSRRNLLRVVNRFPKASFFPLKLYAYKVQLMQRLEPDDKPKRVEFVNTMLDRLGADSDFGRWIGKVHYTGEALRNATEPVRCGFDLNEAAKKFGVLKATLASRNKYPVEGKMFFGPRPVLGEAICNNIREMTHTCF